MNFWTAALFAAVLYDFFARNTFDGFLGPLVVIYIAILTIYVGDKEFERWHNIHQGRHPGEYFVAAWTILIVFLLLASFVFRRDYRLPGEVVSAYITVLGILAITRRSKRYFLQRRR